MLLQAGRQPVGLVDRTYPPGTQAVDDATRAVERSVFHQPDQLATSGWRAFEPGRHSAGSATAPGACGIQHPRKGCGRSCSVHPVAGRSGFSPALWQLPGPGASGPNRTFRTGLPNCKRCQRVQPVAQAMACKQDLRSAEATPLRPSTEASGTGLPFEADPRPESSPEHCSMRQQARRTNCRSSPGQIPGLTIAACPIKHQVDEGGAVGPVEGLRPEQDTAFG